MKSINYCPCLSISISSVTASRFEADRTRRIVAARGDEGQEYRQLKEAEMGEHDRHINSINQSISLRLIVKGAEGDVLGFDG
jgi:hypothetical protein